MGLYYAVHPGDEVRGPRGDIPEQGLEPLLQAIRALNDAELAAEPSIGEPDEAQARSKLDEADRALEEARYWMKREKGTPHEVVVAWAEALDQVDWLLGRRP